MTKKATATPTAQAAPVQTLSIGDLIEAHEHVKGEIAALTAAHAAAVKPLETLLKDCQGELLAAIAATGTDSVKFKVGDYNVSAKREVVTKYSFADRGAFNKFACENDLAGCFQARLNVAELSLVIEALEGQLPPGVAQHQEYGLSITRRAASKT